MKALLLHVGADQSNFNTIGVNGPVFPNNKFEFIPIIEFMTDGHYIEKIDDEYIVKNKYDEISEEALWTTEKRIYSAVNAYNQEYGRKLSDFLPNDFDNIVMHFDPDFDFFTYGDRIETSKGAQIGKLEPGDYLFFVSSLVPYNEDAYDQRDWNKIRRYQRKKMAKYLIGKFKVQASFQAIKACDSEIPVLYEYEDEDVSESIERKMMTRILHNAHSKRDDDIYYLIVGDEQESCLLDRAIRLSENGSPFRPSEYGKQIYGDVTFPRGFKWITDEKKIHHTLGLIKKHSGGT